MSIISSNARGITSRWPEQCARAQVKVHVHKLAFTTHEVARTVPKENPTDRKNKRHFRATSCVYFFTSPARCSSTAKRGTANFGWGWENPISNGISNAQKCAIPRRCTHITYEPTRDIVGLSIPIERFLASTGRGNRR